MWSFPANQFLFKKILPLNRENNMNLFISPFYLIFIIVLQNKYFLIYKLLFCYDSVVLFILKVLI